MLTFREVGVAVLAKPPTRHVVVRPVLGLAYVTISGNAMLPLVSLLIAVTKAVEPLLTS